MSHSQNIPAILSEIRAFVETELLPLEEALIAPDGGFRSLLPVLREKREQVMDMGYWTPQMPERAGGMGLSLADFGRISEELGRTPIGHYVFNCQAPDAGNMEILHQFGTAAQQQQFLAPLMAGAIRSCFSMTEPEHAGSNPVWMSTTAARDGDEYVINGHKWFTTAADGAAFAIVMAITNPEAEQRHARASQIIVPLDTPGVEHVRLIPIMGDTGEDWLSHSELRYNDVRVPVSNLLGNEGTGFLIAQERLGPGRIHHCMRWIGIAERAFDMMCRYSAEREVAPGKPLATRQTVQNWIAESRAEINASRLMVLDAAEKIDAVGAYQARVEISTIKFYVAGMLQRVLDRAIQVHGGLGITDDTLLSFWFRHERGARIYDGPDEVHKTVVARQELKKYGLRITH
ncbi:MAG: acyl-CoA dehydrogenase family protein [Anaerolineae bacterium]|nr:acyl-CoA dehydrogenase family protein [Anaerolineae bacterium]MCO5206257.1 acyl-CoA dehydrogenase family protein [Anaerolineae bacterium]